MNAETRAVPNSELAEAATRGYRWHLLLKGNDAVKVRTAASAAPGRKGAKVAADVDLIETL